MTSLKRLALQGGLLLLLGALASPAWGASIQLPNNLFGNLDQDDVDACKDENGVSFSCGAVATTNSLAFLQRKYPTIYDSKLIPDLNGDKKINYAELKGVAEEVA